ncbi:hypothetical protein TNCV_1950541 [Trichonephila clavipes]|nr:hypothetical protein TNCV_1950541 [Trichonephila clavipes]
MSLTNFHIKGLLYDKFVEIESPHIDVVWKFGKRDASPYVFLFASPRFNIARSVANSPHVASELVFVKSSITCSFA